MNEKDISRAAVGNEPCPENLSQSEIMLFHSLRCLYGSYAAGAIDRTQAIKERKQIISSYRQNSVKESLWDSFAKRYQSVLGLEPRVISEGCELCRRIIAILDGRDRE